jgi:hypothetical protein
VGLAELHGAAGSVVTELSRLALPVWMGPCAGLEGWDFQGLKVGVKHVSRQGFVVGKPGRARQAPFGP